MINFFNIDATNPNSIGRLGLSYSTLPDSFCQDSTRAGTMFEDYAYASAGDALEKQPIKSIHFDLDMVTSDISLTKDLHHTIVDHTTSHHTTLLFKPRAAEEEYQVIHFNSIHLIARILFVSLSASLLGNVMKRVSHSS